MTESASKRPTRANGQATVKKILAAARQIILEQGTDNLSIDRVIKRAGVSKGSFMYHFPTRQDLIPALIEDYARHLHDVQTDLERQSSDKDAALLSAYDKWYRDFTSGSIDQGGSPLVALSLASHDNRELMQPVRDWYRNYFDRVKQEPCGPAAALVATLAYDALFFHHLFGTDVLKAEEKTMILDFLAQLAKKR